MKILVNMTSWYSKETGLYVHMPLKIWHKITKLCNKIFPNECGGVLIGTYDKNLKEAKIKDIFLSKKNVCSRTSLLREAKEANIFLKLLWKLSCGKKYFIGEWHSHPNGNNTPSHTDDNAMFKIAKDKKCECSRPILIILNGNISRGWKDEKIWIYTKEGYRTELKIV